MFFRSKPFRALTLLAGLFVLVAAIGWQSALANSMFKDIKGVVKSVDKGAKTMVVKTADGTEHTVKWTGDTTVEASKGIGKVSMDTYDGLLTGSKVSVKYTEKAGEKTAVAIKDSSKAKARAVTK